MAERSSLVRLQDEYEISIDWRGYELHPETPPGGRSLASYFGAERARVMSERVLAYARQFGITDMVTPPHMCNTRRIIAAAELARDRGVLDPFRAAGMDAYWRHGKDLEDDAVLREIAAHAELDPADALAASRDPAYLGRIDARREEAEAIGITGIPTFVLGNQGLVGCHPYEVLARFVREAGGATPRAPSP